MRLIVMELNTAALSLREEMVCLKETTLLIFASSFSILVMQLKQCRRRVSASVQGTLRDTKCVNLTTVMLAEMSLLWLETTSHYTQDHPGTFLNHNVAN